MNVKAKTGEQVGHIGRGEAIGCHAVVLIERRIATEAQSHRKDTEKALPVRLLCLSCLCGQ